MIYELMGEAIAAFFEELLDGWRGRRQRRKRRKQ